MSKLFKNYNLKLDIKVVLTLETLEMWIYESILKYKKIKEYWKKMKKERGQ